MVSSQHLKGAGGVAFSEFKGLSQWRICASAGGAGVGASSSLFRRSGFAPALKQQVLFDKTVQWSKKKESCSRCYQHNCVQDTGCGREKFFMLRSEPNLT